MNDKPKHTEGDWRVSKESSTIIENEHGQIIGSASGYPDSGYFPSNETAVANAVLMAAAPEMLEALIAQERADWARRNYESISCDPLHPDREALNLEMIQTMSHAASLRKEAIAKAKP
jgi:hypothetical protein